MISDFTIDGVEIHRYVFEPISSNMYIIIKNNTALIIDPHVNEEADGMLRQYEVDKIWIILTHEHFDHISGVNYFRENWSCTVICGQRAKDRLPDPSKNLAMYYEVLFINKECEKIEFDTEYRCYADIGFEGEYEFDWNGIDVHLVETPGHSKGSICIVMNKKYIFTGDSLVEDNEIITRLPGGSKEEYLSITKPFLDRLDKNMIVFPGHGKENILSTFVIT